MSRNKRSNKRAAAEANVNKNKVPKISVNDVLTRVTTKCSYIGLKKSYRK